ncbi:hypothetical protein H261_21763 [Paramagnetospirillum caucaseum]|uniref:Uncharacterized protein n=1 Tax=Paramagnetospirillum caucaseum TaxID=1244869 RepID=M3A4K4_9PROT|nr:hypothetical protein [Paramagnetospirillum caucaseum]EME67778.1 hypothetical protein H261_21763 [Paramagnetospirillum caucaseum]
MPKINDAALATFVVRKAEIDAKLARLANASADHFGYAPDEISWGHVGTFADHAALLKRISDAVFREGEHAIISKK